MSAPIDYRPDWQQCRQNQRLAGSALIYIFIEFIAIVAFCGWWLGY